MAKRTKNKKESHNNGSSPKHDPEDSLSKLISWTMDSGVWVALLLAMVAFWAYRSSLMSDFVYDARKEILEEGFLTSLSNLPDVLSFKTMGTHLMLNDRPGQMLYLMINAAIWGKEPFGYHLSSNLLQAVDVGLLFFLLNRLVTTEMTGLTSGGILKVQFAAAVVTLIFALHPISVESVAEVSYCGSLLVTLFTLSALLMATYFRHDNIRIALLTGAMGTLFAFAAIVSKEPGVAVAPILIVYWFLFRRSEPPKPWFLFLGAVMVVTVAFLVALVRFTAPNQAHLSYLGGSFSQVFLLQPRLWVFMMGKLLWPIHLSADYAPVEMIGPSTPVALVILVVVILLQLWLAYRSRLGALGGAVYWLGLAASSNLIPLYHPVADRFYHLSLAGIAMQLLALFLMTVRSSAGFWLSVTPFFIALLPLTLLTLARENVFVSNLALWTDTVQESPLSETAHYGLGMALFEKGQSDAAIIQFQKALEINPNDYESHNNLGIALFQKGQSNDAIDHFQKALEINSDSAQAHYNLGKALLQKGQINESIAQFQEALRLKPDDSDTQNSLIKAKAMVR